MFKKVISRMRDSSIEGIVISLLTGWVLTSLITGSFKQVFNQSYPETVNAVSWILVFLCCSVIAGVIYYIKASAARITMFFSTYIYMFLFSVESYGARMVFGTDHTTTTFTETWENRGYDSLLLANNAGGTALVILLIGLTLLAFFYVQEDLYTLISKLHITKKKVFFIAIIISLILLIISAVISVLRYIIYMPNTFDLGLYTQMYEYMRQTGRMDTTLERNFLISHLAIHFSPIYYLLLPFYFLFPSPITLDILYAVIITLPIIPIYLLCRHFKLGTWPTIAIILIYALYPATINQCFFDFHENCMLTFLILMVLWGLEANKPIIMAVFSVLTLTVKEDAAFYILIIGMFFLISKKSFWRSSILIISSLVYFFVIQAIMSNYGYGNTVNFYNERFGNLLYSETNSSLFQIIYTVIVNPAYAISQITNNGPDFLNAKIEYICFMILPILLLLFTMKKSYSRLILMIPILIFNILPIYSGFFSIITQYNNGTIALFMYIIILNIHDLCETDAESSATKIKLYKIITISLICTSLMYAGTAIPKLQLLADAYSSDKTIHENIDQVLETIPRDQTIVASPLLTPHLYNALELYDAQDIHAENYDEFAGSTDDSFAKADCIVILKSDITLNRVQQLLSTGTFNLEYEDDVMCVFQKQ